MDTPGYPLKEVSDFLGIHYTTVSKVIQKMKQKYNISRPDPLCVSRPDPLWALTILAWMPEKKLMGRSLIRRAF